MIEVYRWQNLERWDAYTLPHLHIAPHLPQKKIGELLVSRQQQVDRKKWTFDLLQPITIHFGGAISRRKVKKGRDYSMPLFWAKPGDVVLSKIDLKNGAVGVLPDGWNNAVVTSHFKVYSPKTDQLDPRYFRLLLQTQDFRNWLWANRSGADGRTEVKLNVFEALDIPLPPVKEQTALCDAYAAALTRASDLESEADSVERAGLQTFETALGIAAPPPIPIRPVFVAKFKDIERWSHEGILDKSVASNGDNSAEHFPQVALGKVVADLVNGWSPKCLTRSAKSKEWGVLKLGAVSFGEYDDSQNKALPTHLTAKPELEVNQGDVLISRANVIRLVGACAIVRETRPRLMLCDKIFRVVFQESSPIDSEFLGEVMKLPTVRQQIEAAATGTSPTMKNISKPSLLALTFPLPQGPDGIKTQQKLIAALRLARESAASCRLEAKRLRTEAWAAFESTLFNAVETAAQ